MHISTPNTQNLLENYSNSLVVCFRLSLSHLTKDSVLRFCFQMNYAAVFFFIRTDHIQHNRAPGNAGRHNQLLFFPQLFLYKRTLTRCLFFLLIRTIKLRHEKKKKKKWKRICLVDPIKTNYTELKPVDILKLKLINVHLKWTEGRSLFWLLLNRQSIGGSIVDDQRQMSYLWQLGLWNGGKKIHLFGIACNTNHRLFDIKH